MKKPSPYPSILWDMDLKSTPVLNLTRDRHVQAVAVLAAAAVDGLKSEAIERQYPVVLPFFNGGRAHGIRSSAFKGLGVQSSSLLLFRHSVPETRVPYRNNIL